jgi:hypothetical protein
MFKTEGDGREESRIRGAMWPEKMKNYNTKNVQL